MAWILIIILVLWLILGSIFKVAEVVFWIVVVALIISAGAAGVRRLNR